ncbi:MAG: hypothetical protein BSOLF_0055 [Candidatus Carbobacillus altaicus]|uniref:Uncharacterized protein n=1 Tax=Candidatus Carbonibacillus altaicus TaxID=2163959 RepID=A0A2R6XXL5_9BACL|nr:MAG: hypothetical protein BSOLF_0055 [Candidatus Carbobacillus altaicus]
MIGNILSLILFLSYYAIRKRTLYQIVSFSPIQWKEGIIFGVGGIALNFFISIASISLVK